VGPRAVAVGADAIQLFTKTPNQWREPVITAEQAHAFRVAVAAAGARFTASHDSYLINLASPDPVLRARSIESFIAELQRCALLRVDALVSHPGNYIDDRASGIARNADAIAEAFDRAPGSVRLLLEGTAGSGTALGSTFGELAAIHARLSRKHQARTGFCLDTCHLYSSGQDLVRDFDGVWRRFDDAAGLNLLGCLHLNDSATPFNSRRDRHAEIGRGSLGAVTFRRIMHSEHLRLLPKIIETPKGEDLVTNDRRAITLLRRWAQQRARAATAPRSRSR
jgi:deoxyribonuclease-4